MIFFILWITIDHPINWLPMFCLFNKLSILLVCYLKDIYIKRIEGEFSLGALILFSHIASHYEFTFRYQGHIFRQPVAAYERE